VEPYVKRTAHGMILGEGGVKMSKSKGNVINPDDVIAEFGSDVFRCYEMFMGPFDTDAPWDTNGIQGIKRFLDKVWSLRDKITNNNEQITKISDGSKFQVLSSKFESILHKSIKKIGDDIEAMHFNTAISQLMILTNTLLDAESIADDDYKAYICLIAPFAPHITEEIWHDLGYETSIHHESWPEFDPELLIEDQVVIAIQVNGKVRGTIQVASDATEDMVRQAALADSNVERHLAGQEPKKTIYVPGKIFNIVI
jgi:leucyl-tRNA synthetase